ncbi:hypothetical protein Tco_1447923 [Tanacetum coccineum]
MQGPVVDQVVDPNQSPYEPLPSSSHPPVISATTESEPTHVAEPTPHPKSPLPEPDNESIEHTFEQPSPEHQPLSPRQETDIPQSQDPTHPHVAEETTMTMDDLLHLVPKLITKKVKKMEVVLKRRHVVLPDSEDEDAENYSKQGRNLQGGDKGTIVLKVLEAAETLAKVFTQRTKTYTRKVKTGLRRKLDADEVSTGKEINIGFTYVSTTFTDVNTAFEEINSGDDMNISSPKKGQREGKAVLEENISELEMSVTSKGSLDAQVLTIAATKFYTEEDWDFVEPSWMQVVICQYKVLSIDFSSVDFGKKMVELINEKEEALCREVVEKFPMNSELEASNLTRVGLQKNKSKSARFDTEEDLKAYMDERVDETSSEEFQMGSIPQGSAPAKKCLLNDLTRDDLKELYKLMMLKYEDSRPEEEYERVLWGI